MPDVRAELETNLVRWNWIVYYHYPHVLYLHVTRPGIQPESQFYVPRGANICGVRRINLKVSRGEGGWVENMSGSWHADKLALHWADYVLRNWIVVRLASVLGEPRLALSPCFHGNIPRTTGNRPFPSFGSWTWSLQIRLVSVLWPLEGKSHHYEWGAVRIVAWCDWFHSPSGCATL